MTIKHHVLWRVKRNSKGITITFYYESFKSLALSWTFHCELGNKNVCFTNGSVILFSLSTDSVWSRPSLKISTVEHLTIISTHESTEWLSFLWCSTSRRLSNLCCPQCLVGRNFCEHDQHLHGVYLEALGTSGHRLFDLGFVGCVSHSDIIPVASIYSNLSVCISYLSSCVPLSSQAARCLCQGLLGWCTQNSLSSVGGTGSNMAWLVYTLHGLTDRITGLAKHVYNSKLIVSGWAYFVQ